MPVGGRYGDPGRGTSVSQHSPYAESSPHDPFTGHPGVPGLRMVGVLHSQFLDGGGLASSAATAGVQNGAVAAFGGSLNAPGRPPGRRCRSSLPTTDARAWVNPESTLARASTHTRQKLAKGGVPCSRTLFPPAMPAKVHTCFHFALLFLCKQPPPAPYPCGHKVALRLCRAIGITCLSVFQPEGERKWLRDRLAVGEPFLLCRRARTLPNSLANFPNIDRPIVPAPARRDVTALPRRQAAPCPAVPTPAASNGSCPVARNAVHKAPRAGGNWATPRRRAH